jgi:RNase P/RNase MRP subunit p29
MLTLKTTVGSKTVSKLAAERMKIRLSHNTCFIRGSSLIGRPEDRVLRYKGA